MKANCICGNLLPKGYPSRPRKYCSAACQRKYALEAGRTREYPTAENHHNWSSDKVGYAGVHDWIKKMQGKATKCENCYTTTAKRYEWSNISGEYRREIEDWWQLCKSCHISFDNVLQKGWATRHAITTV